MGAHSILEPAHVPPTIKGEAQWICWREADRDGKPTKVPIDPVTESFASTTDPETWADFETALAAASDPTVDGIGFVFTADDDFVGVDLDDCRDLETGDRSQPADELIDRLDSYTEVSPSGTGYHVIVRGQLPDGRNRSGQVELYESARFFTVTGDHVEGTPTTVQRRPDAVVAVHEAYVQDDDNASSAGTAPDRTGAVALSDDELLEKAKDAANGEKFQRLWVGDTSGYPSHSEADMALCCLLAFWTGGDRVRMDRLFRRSGLMRGKWDEVHYADGSTYGEQTIARAVATTPAFYGRSCGAGTSS